MGIHRTVHMRACLFASVLVRQFAYTRCNDGFKLRCALVHLFTIVLLRDVYFLFASFMLSYLYIRSVSIISFAVYQLYWCAVDVVGFIIIPFVCV